MFQRLNVCVLFFFSAGLSQFPTSVFPLETGLGVTCHNFKNVVYWNSSNPQLQQEFIVTIRRYSKPPTFLKTAENYLDISNDTQDDDVYRVSVKTVNGTEDDSPEIIFTYKQDFPEVKKCTVDFPSVNTSASDHKIVISFDHPMDVYDFPEQSDELFTYTVRCNETDCGKYECMDTCTAEIPIPESVNSSCFSLYFRGYVGTIRLEGSEEVCTPTKTESKTGVGLITGIVCAVLVLLLLVIVAGVEVYNKVTGSDPGRTISKILGIVSSDAPVIEPERPQMSEVRSVSHTPLLITPNSDISTPTIYDPEEVTHLPIHIGTGAESSDEEEQRGSEEDEGDFCNLTNGGYDSKKFPFEMSPGDIVEAYRP